MTPLTLSSDRVRRYLTPLLALTVALPAFAQVANNPTTKPADDKAVPVEKANPASEKKDAVLELSPFVVETTKDTGYFAQNTLAGSRMKTNLADLGAAISVVTKAQMEDFATVDLNDAFRYEVNTEGSGTYTPATQAFRNDGVLDVNAGGTQGNAVTSLTNAIANRVRGIGIPSASINYYPINGQLPPDSYNVQSFEISRGPNSLLFGMGSPAGIANTSTAQANLQRDSAQLQLRTDDRGSARVSLSFNQALIQDKLGIYGAALYDNRQFQRKPSYDVTKREYAAVTYKPFSKTTLRANFEHYSNKNRRPNSVSPVDYVTQWNLAGRPIYDALTKKVTLLSTGKEMGPYISSSASPFAQQVRDAIRGMPGYNPALRGTSATAFNGTDTNFTFYNGQPIYGGANGTQLNPVLSLAVPNPSASILWVPGMAQYTTRAHMAIADGQLQNWQQNLYNTTYTTAYAIPGTGGTPAPNNVNNPISNIWNSLASSDMYDRNQYASTGWTNNSFITNLGGYRYPGVTDRAIYDWKEININEANYGSQSNNNYNFELEQQITRDLFFNAGWFRQSFKQTTNYTLGQLNATGLFIDENKYLPDGTPNPYVGKPFVYDRDPDRYINNQDDDHFRGMLAYTPDFTQHDGWLKWLGRHQLLGMWSRDESMSLAVRQRLNYVGAGGLAAAVRYVANPTNNANGTRTGWNFGGSTQRQYYLARPGDPMGVVTTSSGEWNHNRYTGDIRVYNYLTNSFENANVTEEYNTFADPGRNQRIIQSWSGGITSYFWKDRITTTFGARIDKVKTRGTTSAAITQPDGTVAPALTPQQKFLDTGYFNFDSIWNRFQPWSRVTGRTKTGGGVISPFRNWSAVERRAETGNQFWQIVRDFGFVYNWSSNFDAPGSSQIDAFGKQLPNPQGIGHDAGFQFSALDNKLFARVTWFRSTSQNFRVSAGTALGRLTSQVPLTTPDSAQASVDALFKGWARAIVKINMGIDPRIDPAVALTPQQELDIQSGVEKIWGQSYTYYESLPGAITATGQAVATGMEAQINYNTGHWRNRFTFGKQVTRNSNVLKEFDALWAYRSPTWTAAKAATYLLPQYQGFATYRIGDQATGTQVNLTDFLTSYGYNSTVRITNASGGQSVQDWINVNVTPQVQLAKDLDGQEAPGQRRFRWAYNTGYDFTEGRLKNFGVGGAVRWEDKSIIGYMGKSSHGNAANPNLIDISDTTKPVYDKANTYVDLFVNYKRKILKDVRMTLQLNVENVGEDGRLQTVAVNYDGTPYGYRIIDSRKFTLTATFDF